MKKPFVIFMKISLVRLLSFFLKVFYMLRYGGKVSFGKKVILSFKFRFQGKGKLIIEEGANLWTHREANEFFTYDKNAVIQIGAFSRLNGVNIHCKKSVTLGKHCLVGSCILIDTDFHALEFEHRNDPDFIKSNPVIIQDRCWLAGQSVILKGVTVGTESVIGFRAVVSQNIPSRSIAVGNPAHVVKSV